MTLSDLILEDVYFSWSFSDTTLPRSYYSKKIMQVQPCVTIIVTTDWMFGSIKFSRYQKWSVGLLI